MESRYTVSIAGAPLKARKGKGSGDNAGDISSWPATCHGTSILGLPCLIGVLDDEQEFAGAHQTELLACGRFNGGGIFLQAADVVAQQGVLLSKHGERCSHVRILPARPHGLDDPLLSQ